MTRDRITVHVAPNGDYWQAHWTDSDGKRCKRSLGHRSKVSRKQAIAKARQLEDEINQAPSADEPTPPAKLTLAEYLRLYFEQRQRSDGQASHHKRLKSYGKISPGTEELHRMTGRYLTHHFSDDRDVTTIDKLAATQWVDALEQGRLNGARDESKQKYGDLSEQSIRKQLRHAKSIFGWGLAFGLLDSNPFADFTASVIESSGSGRHVTGEELTRLLAACNNQGWRTFLALQRLAGLRRGEALALPWNGKAKDRHGIEHAIGVDVERQTISLVAEKTSKHRSYPSTLSYWPSLPCPMLRPARVRRW